ncbi:hypothetical protein LINPERPRIM_LOCUS37598, partial [Linum perenne]
VLQLIARGNYVNLPLCFALHSLEISHPNLGDALMKSSDSRSFLSIRDLYPNELSELCPFHLHNYGDRNSDGVWGYGGDGSHKYH